MASLGSFHIPTLYSFDNHVFSSVYPFLQAAAAAVKRPLREHSSFMLLYLICAGDVSGWVKCLLLQRYILLGANQSPLKESNEWKLKTMNLFAIQGWLALYSSRSNDNASLGLTKEPIHMPSDSLHNNSQPGGLGVMLKLICLCVDDLLLHIFIIIIIIAFYCIALCNNIAYFFI